MEFLALQEYEPKEHLANQKCIWCLSKNKKNKAHIISKRLTLTSHKRAILTYSVCEKCNAYCGRIEDWVLHNSPLSWVRFYLYFNSNKSSNSSFIPSYYYALNLKNWVVFSIGNSKNHRAILPQILIYEDESIFVLSEREPYLLYKEVVKYIQNGQFKIEIKESLPKDFLPRVLLIFNKVVITAHNKDQAQTVISILKKDSFETISIKRIKPQDNGNFINHFKWSNVNWAKFCIKTAFECLSLFEGSEFCMKNSFDMVRNFINSGLSKESREMVVDKFGYFNFFEILNKEVIAIDLTNNQNCNQEIAALIPTIDIGMHSVILYELEGFICCTVSISGLKPVVSVLAGPDEHLQNLYLMNYDEKIDKFSFLKLAYDLTKPVVSIPIPNGLQKSLINTYKLRFM